MKMLYILNVANKVNSFCMSSLLAAKELQYDFHIAGNWGYKNDAERLADQEKYGIKIHQIDFIRSPFDLHNIKAYKQLKELMKAERYDLVHCNTPIGGLLGRICAKSVRVPHVIYQAHGFHFYKGAPKLNWMLYYPVEKWLAHYTDALITINSEDCELAKSKFKLRNGGKVYYVPGVGIDTSLYKLDGNVRVEKRKELGLGDDDVAVISMGDLIERKNYTTAIRAIADAKNPKLQYFICGNGPEKESLMELVQKLGVNSQIHFLGFRSDIKDLLKAADIFLFTTKQEGLPRSMMEAMASGLPCIASRVRGNTDLLEKTGGGFLYDTDDISDCAAKLNLLATDEGLRKEMGRNNLSTILNFKTEFVSDEIRRIYDAEIRRGGVTLNEFIDSLIDYFPLYIKKRVELNIPLDAFVLLSVGELNENKNNSVIIKAIERLKEPNIHYILCGVGEKEKTLKEQANEANLQSNIHFIGYRTDVKEIYAMSDCFVLPSYREGLSRSLMEAMACGLPCIVSKIRGNVDLIDDGGGYYCNARNDNDFTDAIKNLFVNKNTRKEMGKHNQEKVKKYDIVSVEKKLIRIYQSVL